MCIQLRGIFCFFVRVSCIQARSFNISSLRVLIRGRTGDRANHPPPPRNFRIYMIRIRMQQIHNAGVLQMFQTVSPDLGAFHGTPDSVLASL